MSTFYLMPPRPFVIQQLAGLLQALFPGSQLAGADLLDLLEATVARPPAVFVVFREELPDGTELAQALTELFGAEPGDDVVEVRPGGRPGEVTARRWQLAA